MDGEASRNAEGRDGERPWLKNEMGASGGKCVKKRRCAVDCCCGSLHIGHRARFEISLSLQSQRRHGRIRSAKEYIRLFPVFSRFPAFRPCLSRAGSPVATAPTPSVLVVAADASMSLPDWPPSLWAGVPYRAHAAQQRGQTRGAMGVVRWADERCTSASGARRPAKPMDGRRIIRVRRPRLLEA